MPFLVWEAQSQAASARHRMTTQQQSSRSISQPQQRDDKSQPHTFNSSTERLTS